MESSTAVRDWRTAEPRGTRQTGCGTHLYRHSLRGEWACDPAPRGEVSQLQADGSRKTVGYLGETADLIDKFDSTQWHTYRIVARGNRAMHDWTECRSVLLRIFTPVTSPVVRSDCRFMPAAPCASSSARFAFVRGNLWTGIPTVMSVAVWR